MKKNNAIELNPENYTDDRIIWNQILKLHKQTSDKGRKTITITVSQMLEKLDGRLKTDLQYTRKIKIKLLEIKDTMYVL